MITSLYRFLLRTAVFLLLVSGLVFATGRLALAQSLSDVSQVVSIEVLPGWRAPDGSHVAALSFRMRPGWKTYWRSAGAAGIAPRLDWSTSENVASVTPIWPSPKVFRQGGALSIGYDDDFILPLVIEAANTADPVVLSGQLDIGVCADICVPAHIDVHSDLPVTAEPDLSIRAALSDQPRQVQHGIACDLRQTAAGMTLTGGMDLPPLGGQEAVVFEVPNPGIWVTDALVHRVGMRLEAESELLSAGGTEFDLDRGAVRITVIGKGGAVEMNGCAS